VKDPRTFNRYAYAFNNPFKYVDYYGFSPTGHHMVPQTLWKGKVSASVEMIFESETARIFNENYNFHNGKILNGISHWEYTRAVQAELKSFIDMRKIAELSKLKEVDAIDFLKHLERLPKDNVISLFNSGVRKEIEYAIIHGKQIVGASKTVKTIKGLKVSGELAKRLEKAAVLARTLRIVPVIHYVLIGVGVAISVEEAHAAGWTNPEITTYVMIDALSPVGAILPPSEINRLIEMNKGASNYISLIESNIKRKYNYP